jgi:hypothetical protein
MHEHDKDPYSTEQYHLQPTSSAAQSNSSTCHNENSTINEATSDDMQSKEQSLSQAEIKDVEKLQQQVTQDKTCQSLLSSLKARNTNVVNFIYNLGHHINQNEAWWKQHIAKSDNLQLTLLGICRAAQAIDKRISEDLVVHCRVFAAKCKGKVLHNAYFNHATISPAFTRTNSLLHICENHNGMDSDTFVNFFVSFFQHTTKNKLSHTHMGESFCCESL